MPDMQLIMQMRSVSCIAVEVHLLFRSFRVDWKFSIISFRCIISSSFISLFCCCNLRDRSCSLRFRLPLARSSACAAVHTA